MALAIDWWVALSIIVGLISLFIVALMHMVAKAFSMQGLNMWVRSEYAQVGVTFLIIFFGYAMQTAGGQVISQVAASVSAASGNIPLNAISVANLGDPMRIARGYIEAVVKCEKHVYAIVFVKNFFTEAYSKISLDFLGVEAIAGGFFLSGFVSLYHYIMNNIVYLVLFHYIQYYIIVFSQYTMLPIFLPIGLVLRSFAPTRGAGGLIVAFAMGFAFVFPMTYVLIVAMMPNTNVLCNQVDIMAQSPEITGQDPCLNNAGALMEGYYKLKSRTAEESINVGFLESLIGMFYLQAMFYPLVSLTIVFTFIRQTGSLFGADLAEIGRGLIKII